MGKTTLCNAIMGLVPVQRGSIRFAGVEIAGLPPHQIAARGIGYTPQGRRLWPSLTVDEHLRSEEHTSELQSLMRISYAVFCLKKKKTKNNTNQCTPHTYKPT